MNQNKTEDEEYFKKGKRQSSLIDPLQVLLAYFESSPNFFYVAHRNTPDIKPREDPSRGKLWNVMINDEVIKTDVTSG